MRDIGFAREALLAVVRGLAELIRFKNLPDLLGLEIRQRVDEYPESRVVVQIVGASARESGATRSAVSFAVASEFMLIHRAARQSSGLAPIQHFQPIQTLSQFAQGNDCRFVAIHVDHRRSAEVIWRARYVAASVIWNRLGML